MRISSVGLALLLLAGCGKAPDEKGSAARPAQDRIACALSEGAAFQPTCLVDRTRDADGLLLTLRKPDGGFHRLRVTRDGRGVAAADGAEPATVRVLDPRTIEVAIGGGRYRLPAHVGPVPPT